MRTEHRLALLFAGILGFTTTLAFISLRIIIVDDATRRLDASLQGEAGRIAADVATNGELDGEGVKRLVGLRSAGDVAAKNPLAIVRDSASQPVLSSFPLSTDDLRPGAPSTAEIERRGGSLETVKTGNEELRVFTGPLRDQDGSTIGSIQVAGRTQPLAASTDRLEAVLLGEGLFSLLLGCLAAVALTRNTLRPLHNMVAALKRTDGPKGQRLATEGPPDIQLVAATLNDMFARFEEADAKRREFLMTVSHELRTPLTALRGTTEVMLLEQAHDRETTSQLETIHAEIGRLLRLSQNLLSVEQARDEFELERMPVDLEDLVLTVALEASWRGSNALSLEIAQPVVAEVDPDRVRQALLNLIDNAFRHGGRWACLRLYEDGGWAVIEVEDDGPGVSSNERDLVFQRFYRGETPSSGSGLGLAVVAWVARAHGGRIDLRERDGRWARFQLRVPATLPGREHICDEIATMPEPAPIER